MLEELPCPNLVDLQLCGCIWGRACHPHPKLSEQVWRSIKAATKLTNLILSEVCLPCQPDFAALAALPDLRAVSLNELIALQDDKPNVCATVAPHNLASVTQLEKLEWVFEHQGFKHYDSSETVAVLQEIGGLCNLTSLTLSEFEGEVTSATAHCFSKLTGLQHLELVTTSDVEVEGQLLSGMTRLIHSFIHSLLHL